MFDRRIFLSTGAVALAGCAAPTSVSPDPGADVEFRTFVDRLAERSRAARPFLLQRYDASRLTSEDRILYEAIAPGLDADAALSRRNWGNNDLPTWSRTVTARTGARWNCARATKPARSGSR